MNNPTSSTPPIAQSVQQLLAVLTARLGIGLLLVWLIRSALVRFSFIRTFSVPSVPLSSEQIITSIAYVIALVLLLGYARVLRALWPQVFPRQAPLASALAALVYVGALVAGYSALERPVSVLTEDTGLLLLQAIALVIAVVLLVWAGRVSYQHVPLWFAELRMDLPPSILTEVACLNCGRLNPASMKFCGYCGKRLPETSETRHS